MEDTKIPNNVRAKIEFAALLYEQARAQLEPVNQWLDEEFGEFDDGDPIYSARFIAMEALNAHIVYGNDLQAFEAGLDEAYKIRSEETGL